MKVLNGNKFGRLFVIDRDKKDPRYVICLCDCGRTARVRATSLTKRKRPTQSCGCMRSEVMRDIGKRVIKNNSKRIITTNAMYNTNFQIIENTALPKNNRSGHKGVWYDKSRGLYFVYINLHKKRKFLGRYNNLNDAISAREQAEEELFAPVIAEKDKYTKEKEV